MRKKQYRPSRAKAVVEKRRQLFIAAYLTGKAGGDTNGTRAAIEAGFAPRSAAVTASRLLKDPQIKAAVAKRHSEVITAAQEKHQLTADEMMESLARTLRFDPRKLYREDGSLKPVHELDADTADALAGVEVVEMAGGMKLKFPALDKDGNEIKGAEPVLQHIPMYTKKVKWLDKNAAREQGMKHFGLYELDNRQKPAPSVNVGVLTVPAEALNFDKVRARALKAA